MWGFLNVLFFERQGSPRLIGWLAPIVFLVWITGCTSDDNAPDIATGWVGPLNNFTRISGTANSGVFIRSTESAAPQLNAVHLASVEITVAPGSDLASIFSEDFGLIRKELEKVVEDALRGSVKMSPRPGPDIYSLHVALTNLMIKHGGGPARPGDHDSLQLGYANAAIEAVLRDGPTHRRRAVIITRFADTAGSLPDIDRWANMPAHLRTLVGTFHKQFAAAANALADARATAPPPRNR